MSSQLSPKSLWLAQRQREGASVSDEVLQKVDDPIAELRKLGDKTAVVVPYEYLWPPELKPFTNPEHKRQYDADLLAEHLEAASYGSHIIKTLEFSGFVFLTAEATRILNSKERRRQKREHLQNRDRPEVEGELKPSDELPDNAGQAGSG